MSDFATLAPYLWWTMLLASTAIILHDLASKLFAGKPSNNAPSNNTQRAQKISRTLPARDLINRPIEISSTGFQKEAADAILAMALAAHMSPLTKIPERQHEMMEQLFRDVEIRQFIEMNSGQTLKKIDRKELKQELTRTYMMLERAERLYR
jgi:hypothetical protein